MAINPEQVKNILVFRNDRLGEFLLNIPAIRALRESFIYAKIICVVDPALKELAQATGLIDETLEWRQGGHSSLEKINMIGLLRGLRIDLAVMLNPSQDFNIITFFAGIPFRIGYNRKWGFLLTHKMEDQKGLGKKHEVEYNLDLVGLIGAYAEDKSLSMIVDDGIIKNLSGHFGRQLESNLVVLHPWTSDQIKQWPYEYFYELARRLVQEQGLNVVVVGGLEELENSRIIFAKLENNLVNLTGKTTLMQLAALLKRGKMLISGDSGPVHLASAVHTPVVAIFRNDIAGKTPKRWGPWGDGHIVIAKSDLSQITVDEVIEKTKEVLAR